MSNLVPINAKPAIERLRGRVLNLFDRWMPARSDRAEVMEPARWPDALMGFGVTPAVDVAETDDAVVVAAEMPGLSEKDFHVELRDGSLILRGEKQTSRKENRDGWRYTECSYGSFYRAVPMPCEVNPDQASASYKHGVLRVTLPKTEAARRRSVHVKVA